jgi:hypothetical protein
LKKILKYLYKETGKEKEREREREREKAHSSVLNVCTDVLYIKTNKDILKFSLGCAMGTDC